MNPSLFHGFLMQISLMLVVAWLFGGLMKKLGQSAVLGELLGGIVLGPTLLGKNCPELYNYIFTSNQEVNNSVLSFLKLGMLFFMFSSGLEINLAHFRQHKFLIAATSFFGSIVPFALGVGLVLFVPQLWGLTDHQFWLALFIGTLFSISALPVIARILIDFGLIGSKIGLTIMTSAMVNDVIGWSLVAYILQNFKAIHPDSNVLFNLAPLILYIGIMLSFGRRLVATLFKLSHHQNGQNGSLTLITLLILLVATSAEKLGVHEIFAVFVLGMVIGHNQNKTQNPEAINHASSIIQAFSLNFFAPIYFVSVGLKINLNHEFDSILVLSVIITACLGKLLGAGIGAKLGGMTWREAWCVGVGLNARGAIGLVLASVALEHQLINQRIFVSLVLMALITTLLSGILLKRLVD